MEQWKEECRAEEQLPDLVVEDEAQGLRVEERQPDLGGRGAAARSWGGLGLGETEGVGENPEKINPFQPNPTRFASKPIPFQPIYPLNPLTPIQTIPQNNPTQKLQILSDPLASLLDWDKTYIETVHQHSAKSSAKPSTKETSYLHLLFTYILCAQLNLQQAAIQVRRQHSAPNQPPPPQVSPPELNPAVFADIPEPRPCLQSFHVRLWRVAEGGGAGAVRKAPHRLLPIPCCEWAL